MATNGKKHKASKEMLAGAKIDSWRTALEFVVKNARAKFDESVDVDIVLGIDPSKGEQTVRGSALFPHGTGKKMRVLVFCKDENVDIAKNAGADYAGLEELIEKISDGWLEFDAAVATPDVMGAVGTVAKILGPRSLLPNKKIGTVTSDVASIVNDLKKGRVSFRNDKTGVLHAPFGKVSFGADKLLENLQAFMKVLQASKPPTSKGKFLKKITVSSTMGVGVSINPDEMA